MTELSDLERDYPETVVLRFASAEDKAYFLGQLSDGFGENECQLHWDTTGHRQEYIESGESFDNAPQFGVEVYRNYE